MNRQCCPLKLIFCAGFCFFILLNGCVGCAIHNVRPEVQKRAETLLLRGIRAEIKGDARNAEKLLKESLAVSASIEDNHGKATALINLARLHRSGHDMVQAAENIDAALRLINQDSSIYAEATYEKALIVLTTSSAESALTWAEKSVGTEKGALLGRRLNLLGRIQLARNDLSSATLILQKAMDENRSCGNAEEEANSLRMLGIIARNNKMASDAERFLTASLEIDKKIGASSKIAMDMEELGKTALATGNPVNAIRYMERAYDVHLNANRFRQASATLKGLAKIFSLQGDAAKADSALKTAQELSTKTEIQQLSTSPDTIRPSNSP